MIHPDDGLAGQTKLAILLFVLRRRADYAVCIGVAYHNFPIRQFLLALFLHGRVVLLLDVVLVPVEQLLDGVAPQEKETFLDGLFALRHLVHASVC